MCRIATLCWFRDPSFDIGVTINPPARIYDQIGEYLRFTLFALKTSRRREAGKLFSDLLGLRVTHPVYPTNFFATKLALCPPKPNELLTMAFTCISRAVCGT